MRVFHWGLLLLVAYMPQAFAQQPVSFTVVPLGVKGGLDEGNLSAYLVAPAGTTSYVCLDAGSLHQGIEKAIANNVFSVKADTVLRNYLKAYLISHAHLDHVAGLLLNAPDDASKSIYGLAECLTVIQRDYFNWHAWPNFGSGGNPPALRKYQLHALAPRQQTTIERTAMNVQCFPLSHGAAYQSAAFLLESKGAYLLYLGDTGADELEKSHNLRDLWQAVQPLVVAGKLKAVFLEASYPNEQPENQLFGHLTPARLMQELSVLGQLAGAKALRGLPVVITHLKPTAANEAAIKKQLKEANKLQVKLIFPEQGHRLEF